MSRVQVHDRYDRVGALIKRYFKVNLNRGQIRQICREFRAVSLSLWPLWPRQTPVNFQATKRKLSKVSTRKKYSKIEKKTAFITLIVTLRDS